MTATYSPEDNKLRLYSATRLPRELYERVRAAGFIWAPKQDLFVAPAWTPDRVDLLEELCGEIGDEDTSLVDRAEVRAERFEGYRERRTADADGAHKAVARLADNIPLGQPLLIGHHSERHARRDAERIETGMRRAVKMWETANYWQSRAAGAIRHAKYLERPDVRHRRIKKLESERRKEQKTIKTAEIMTKLWRTPGLTVAQALRISNVDHIPIQVDGNKFGTSLWDLLSNEKITPEAAAENAIDKHTRTIARRHRWIEHLTNRLTYERAMLGESGWKPPARPKTKTDLPLLNYSGEVAYRNLWHAGELIRGQAVGITKAELAAIHADYKGTRLSECGTHRVRTAILGRENSRGLVAIYLTDSKQHERPTPEEVNEQAEAEAHALAERMAAKMRAAQERAAALRPTSDERAAPFDAMKESLRAGVQVVSAPQLFPTPDTLADRMVEMAGLAAGQRILEPSAGTGSILRAIARARVQCVGIAVEINTRLADQLSNAEFIDLIQVREADFLECEELGTFDRILMNPPFAHGADIKHILHARSMLRAGGHLVAICVGGPRQEATLRPLAATWEELPAGTFAGTGVRAVLLTLTGER